MRHKNLIILAFVVFFNLFYTNAPLYSVKYVYDGDTILIHNGEKVRYLGIDAPEMGYNGEKNEFMAVESMDYNRRLVGGESVRLEFDSDKKDFYGRRLAYVYLENGDMVNGLLVQSGLARVMVQGPKTKHFNRLLGDQREAMEKQLGIWRNTPINPEPYYIGNKKSYRFHRPECPFGKTISPKNRVRFINYRQASWEGFSPCKKCNP